MTSKIKGTEGIEFPDTTVQGSAAYTKAESDGPAFRANRITTDQSVTSGVYTKLICQNETFDTANSYDTTTGRFTPNVAGIYQVNGTIYGKATTTNGCGAQVYLNGVGYAASYGSYTSTETIQNVSCLVELNGTTDYLELFGVVTGTSPTFSTGLSQFSAALVRKT